jgi:predicted CoA-substrate-specific enzyme activase
MAAALDDAGAAEGELAGICATGFAENCVPQATVFLGETACHARGAFHFHPRPMSVIDLGGRDPKIIHVDDRGLPTAIHTLRRCAAGIGTFLIFAARQLDIHPTRLQEMANMAEQPAEIGSYCSIFSGQDILEKLRDGATREEIALGCLHSIADRVIEIDNLAGPARVTGGVAEYFPGVLQILTERTGVEIKAVPQPILAGAVGAALWALRAPLTRHEQGVA